MKRKTNLFYLEGPDSNFLTFSNYAEYLTGNFVSTDYKLFPSKFLCLYIPNLCEENTEHTDANKKAQFIKYWLVGYYENKLAILRDECIKSEYNLETYIHPKEYLCDMLHKYSTTTNSNIEISYIGEITEQNFNGTYTDSICIIDGNNFTKGQFVKTNEQNVQTNEGAQSKYDYLYGWEENELPEAYKDPSLQIFDDNIDDEMTNKYYRYNAEYYIEEVAQAIKTTCTTASNTASKTILISSDSFSLEDNVKIRVNFNNSNTANSPKLNVNGTGNLPIYYNGEEITLGDNKYLLQAMCDFIYTVTDTEIYWDLIDYNITKDTLKFNCIIPLFDVVNINYQMNNTNINFKTGTVSENNNLFKYESITNIPMGIWFANDTVILEKDPIVHNQFPVWSLVISSQFKALPYFKGINSEYGIIEENELYDNIYNNAYSTFAQVLSRQNTLLNTFNKLLTDFNYVKERLNKIENKVNKLELTSNNDILQRQMIDLNNQLKDEMKAFKTYIENGVLGNLKWKIAT